METQELATNPILSLLDQIGNLKPEHVDEAIAALDEQIRDRYQRYVDPLERQRDRLAELKAFLAGKPPKNPYYSFRYLRLAELVGGAAMQRKPVAELTDEEKRAYRALARAAKRVQDLESKRHESKPKVNREVTSCK